MKLNILPWLLKGHNRDVYSAEQEQFVELFSFHETFLLFCCLVGIIGARVLFNRNTRSWFRSISASRKISSGDVKKIREEFWVLIGNVIMLAFAVYVTLERNGGCTFTKLAPCLEGWPNHTVDRAVVLYYSMELAWYLHLLLKTSVGYGEPDGLDMKMHHAASLLLLVLSRAFNLTRGGVLVLTLFGISNPSLHAAKICNQLLPYWRIAAFGTFSLLFFITRVVLVPAIILRLSLFMSRDIIPYAVEDFFGPYILFNGLLILLYLMQLQWMLAIVRVLRKSATEGSEAAATLSAKLDPAKRFAATSDS